MYNSIDYVTICYLNYDLILLQIENFEKKFIGKNFKLIVVDNTPPSHKNQTKIDEIRASKVVSALVEIDFSSIDDFDGISHGRAIDLGVTKCTADVVCVFDSDLFFIKEDIHEYVLDRFKSGLTYVGCEFNDGSNDSLYWSTKFSEGFSKGCFYCSFYSKDILKGTSWVTSREECSLNEVNGFIEMGWKVRKFVIDNALPGLQWKAAERIRPTTFLSEEGEPIVIHLVRGSFRLNETNTLTTLRGILKI